VSASVYWREVRDVAESSVASALATGSDALVFAGLMTFLVPPLTAGWSAGLAALVGGVIHFGLSRWWVFRRFDAPVPRAAVLYFAMSWAAAAGHGLLVGSLTAWLAPGWAWILSKGVLWVGWTYPMSRLVVFNGDGNDE
jgi:hypothetical protein